MRFFPGFFLLSGILVHADSTLHDKALAFEQAVRATAPNRSSNYSGVPTPDVSEVDVLVRDQQNLPTLENVVRQLMASRPSVAVESTGDELLAALDQEQRIEAQAFAAKAESVLAQAKKTVVQATSPADLDGLLAQLRPLAEMPNEWSYADPTAMALTQKLNSAQQFVLAWQDYLSASTSGHGDEVRQALERILDNPQLTSLDFFPRSELLARRDGRPADQAPSGTPAQNAQAAADAITATIEKVGDIDPALSKILALPGIAEDYVDLFNLEHKRADVLAGLPVTLDLKSVMTGREFGVDCSRIEALELLAILPVYLDTTHSNPRKDGETVSGYLDRLVTEASAANDLALLQRALCVKVSLAAAALGGSSQVQDSYSSCQKFLAGLSQEAAGQYASAVISYKNALGDYDPLLPAKIVGDRLAAIKANHPREFDQALTTLQTPPSNFDPRFPPGFPPPFPPRPSPVIAVLPIPATLSVPAHAGVQPSGNGATPANR